MWKVVYVKDMVLFLPRYRDGGRYLLYNKMAYGYRKINEKDCTWNENSTDLKMLTFLKIYEFEISSVRK